MAEGARKLYADECEQNVRHIGRGKVSRLYTVPVPSSVMPLEFTDMHPTIDLALAAEKDE